MEDVWSSGGYVKIQGDDRIALRINNDGKTENVIRTSCFQIITFDTLDEALNWFNSGLYMGKV